MELAAAVWSSLDGTIGATLLVPLGSCEQHGPHLPLGTDALVARTLAEAVADLGPDRWVAPPVAYGSSGEHQAFPGTLSIGTEALTAVLVELGRSALGVDGSPFGRLVLVNGHGGNRSAVDAAVDRLVTEGRAVSGWSPVVRGGDLHAGRTETSLLLAIAPTLVGAARPVGNTAPLHVLLPELRSGGVRPVAPDGVLGDSTAASVEEGTALLSELVRSLDDHVGRLEQAADRPDDGSR